jgi:UDP-N-acetylmuramate--alanine ligase
VFVLFQPHRYSRTQAIADEFAGCFRGAHKVWITDIYPAGEKPIEGIDANTIIDRVRANGDVAVEYAASFESMVERCAGEMRAGDIAITMGAGDISRVGELLLTRLASTAGRKG